MIEVNGEYIDKIEKKNILYITYERGSMNLYSCIEKCNFCKVVLKDGIDNLSLESYDAYIVTIDIFRIDEKRVIDFLERLYLFNKPVIIVYSSFYQDAFKGLEYLKERFNIKLERRDASIIYNTYEDYIPKGNIQYLLSLISDRGDGKAYIKNTKNCFILRFGNISIIHDVELEFLDNLKKRVKQLPTLLLNLLQIPESTEKPKWIDDIKVLDEIQIENNLKDIEKDIEKLNKEREKIKKQLEINNEYKKVLYTSGDELVEIVSKMLAEMLKISITDLDVRKEDLSFCLDNKKVLAEIKGVNTAIKRDHVSQTQRHIQDDAIENNIDDDDIQNKYKGLLIVNPYIKTPIKERIEKEFYSNTVKGDIKHYDICAIDTITFLGIFEEFRKGNIDIKKIILNSNYHEPDFSAINK